MKELVIVSRYPMNARFKIEGHGYTNKKEAQKMIEVFKARELAEADIQEKYNLGFADHEPKKYAIAHLDISESFLKD